MNTTFRIGSCLFISFHLIILASCSDEPKKSDSGSGAATPVTPIINYAVVKYHPHDTLLYTEGLLFHNGQLFESSGSPDNLPQTKSVIGISDLATGKFNPKIQIDRSKYFGEGIVFLNNKLYQLTYKNQVGFIYDAKTFNQIGQFNYLNKEGWSLTTDGSALIMSDGTDIITYLDPEKFNILKTLHVKENGLPRDSLNELEFIKGYIYANIWLTDLIVKIDTANGNVVGRLNFSSLTNEARIKYPNAEALNGIAYDSTTDRIFITGKMWTNIYEVQFQH